MNQREHSSVPAGAGQVLPCLALLLLPLVGATKILARPGQVFAAGDRVSKPYLAILGAPALRFEEAAPPPDLVTRPAASAPPRPAPAGGQDSNPPAPGTPVAPAPKPVSEPIPASNENNPNTSATEPAEAPAPVRTPPPILPDEIRPQARPEDFLPFFQIPTAQPGVNAIVPVPRTPTLPASSATYTQSPR